jgi:hypothetical protein
MGRITIYHTQAHCTVIGSQGGASRHHRAGSWRAYCFVRRIFGGESECVTAGTTKRNVDNKSAPNNRRAGRKRCSATEIGRFLALNMGLLHEMEWCL